MKCPECKGQGSIETKGGRTICPTCDGVRFVNERFIRANKKFTEIDETELLSEKITDQRAMGLYEKFVVFRVDKRDEPGGDRFNARLFVLDITNDPFALPALRAYAKACEKEYPLLAKDLKGLAETAGKDAG